MQCCERFLVKMSTEVDATEERTQTTVEAIVNNRVRVGSTSLYEFSRINSRLVRLCIRDFLFTLQSSHTHWAPAQQLVRLRLLNEQV